MTQIRAVVGLVAVALTAAACGEKASSNSSGSSRPAASRYSPNIGPQSDSALRNPRAQIFLEKGCPQCHAITALDVRSPSNAGPDLTLAVSDVRSRFNTTLDEFFRNPTGTMQIVLSAQIRLSDAERDSIVGLLRAIHPSDR